jgi:hypothetical protein
MSNDPEGQAGDEQVDEEMARADRTNGEPTTQDEPRPPQRSEGTDPEASRADPDAPGSYVSDGESLSVAEPNEPA